MTIFPCVLLALVALFGLAVIAWPRRFGHYLFYQYDKADTQKIMGGPPWAIRLCGVTLFVGAIGGLWVFGRALLVR